MSDITVERLVQEILDYRCPRYEELPIIPLYSDQVIDALNHYTAPFFFAGDEQALTPAMINNYVKQRVIAPPVKKRYDRDQLARLYCICLLKRVFTISEIKGLLEVQTRSYPFPVAYNYFCVELEKALQATFSTRDFSAPSSANRVTPESELVRSSVLCFANKMFSMKYLEYVSILWEEQEGQTTKP